MYNTIFMKYPEEVNPETQSRLVIVRGWRKEDWGVTGYGVFFWDDKNISELDRGDGCKLSMY